MNFSSRVTKLNNAQENTKGRYILYWMQMFKRASHNYALNFAIEMANTRRLPLVVYEGLKYYYPWASDRFHTGLLHNYVRMLWGKRVIEWQRSYEMAFELLVHLNNKYALDGRDPNSYAGILWCFGKHDRPWFERDVFGTIRYMSSQNMGKKFRSKEYIRVHA